MGAPDLKEELVLEFLCVPLLMRIMYDGDTISSRVCSMYVVGSVIKRCYKGSS
jgi:hypothetical protein